MADVQLIPGGMDTYSDAFGKFFETEDDIAGAYAYALYKKQKREFIVRNGLSPDHERVRNYHCDLNESRVNLLRELAESKLNERLDNVVEAVEDSLREELLNSLLVDGLKRQEVEIANLSEQHSLMTEKVIRSIDDTKSEIISGTKLWKSVLAGVVASAVFGLVLTWAKVIDWTNPFASQATSVNSHEKAASK